MRLSVLTVFLNSYYLEGLEILALLLGLGLLLSALCTLLILLIYSFSLSLSWACTSAYKINMPQNYFYINLINWIIVDPNWYKYQNVLHKLKYFDKCQQINFIPFFESKFSEKSKTKINFKKMNIQIYIRRCPPTNHASYQHRIIYRSINIVHFTLQGVFVHPHINEIRYFWFYTSLKFYIHT